MRPTLIALATAATFAAASATAAPATAAIAVYNSNITQDEVQAAMNGWCKALVAISTTGRKEGREAAAALAGRVLDDAYGYNLGPVLFKPTLTEGEQTFRTTRDGALAYFVGGNPSFPNDTGFALKPWASCKVDKVAMLINGDVATTMGNVMITGTDGKVTTVDKTWQFKKTDDGKLRIVLHHSSLPFSAD